MREQSVTEKKLRLVKDTLRRISPQASKLGTAAASWPNCTSWDPNTNKTCTDPRQ
jgi:hypothetical protein